MAETPEGNAAAQDDAPLKQVNPLLKLGLEVGPLAVFFLGFQFGEELLQVPAIANFMGSITGPEVLATKTGPLFLATLVFMVAIAISLTVSWAVARTLPRMAVVTAVVVAVFGGLTLILRDETFIKMKPTVVNLIFALILSAGLVQGRSYIKYLMEEALPLDNAGWMIFTRRWVGFFLFMAVLNEVIWRTQSDEFWVNFKTFGSMPLTFIFMMAQYPLIQRHLVEEDKR